MQHLRQRVSRAAGSVASTSDRWSVASAEDEVHKHDQASSEHRLGLFSCHHEACGADLGCQGPEYPSRLARILAIASASCTKHSIEKAA